MRSVNLGLCVCFIREAWLFCKSDTQGLNMQYVSLFFTVHWVTMSPDEVMLPHSCCWIMRVERLQAIPLLELKSQFFPPPPCNVKFKIKRITILHWLLLLLLLLHMLPPANLICTCYVQSFTFPTPCETSIIIIQVLYMRKWAQTC